MPATHAFLVGNIVLTPSDLKSARKALGLSQAGLAERLRMNGDRTIRRWEAGEDIPGPAQVAIEFLLKEHAQGVDHVD